MENIRSALSLLLTLNYVFGLKIVEFSTYRQRYLSLLYVLLFWSVYYFLFRYTVLPYIYVYTATYHICFYVEMSIVLLSTAIGIYHNKVKRYWYCSLIILCYILLYFIILLCFK